MGSIPQGTGKVIKHAKIVLIYWGGQWARSPQISSGELTTVFSAILATPSLSRMVQYGRICNPRIVGTFTDLSTEFPERIGATPAFHQSELQAMLAANIDQGTIPAPDTNPDLLYMVVSQLSAVCFETAAQGAAGFHTKFDHNGTTVHYAWISNSGSLTAGNMIPKTFVHELVEACSDPEGDSFTRPGPTGEIGDLCNTDFVPMPNIRTPNAPNGIVIQGYFSDLDNGCVMPTTYSLRWWRQATNSDLTKGVRQFVPRGGSVRAMLTCSDLLPVQVLVTQSKDQLGGTLVVDGRSFTPGGTVQIVIHNVPNRTADFERFAHPGPDGTFHFSEEFHCTSTNSGDAAAVVSVNVTDLATFSSVTESTGAEIWVCAG